MISTESIHDCRLCKGRVNPSEGYCLHCGSELNINSEIKEVSYIG